MNFFCSLAELNEYAEQMEVNQEQLIRADLERAVWEAKEIFEINI